MQTFNPTASSIDIQFTCPTCGTEIEETIDEIPFANMESETIRESQNSDEQEIVCPECGVTFTAHIYVNQVEGNIEIKDELDNEVDDFDITNEECVE